MGHDKSKPLRGVVHGQAADIMSRLHDGEIGAIVSDPPSLGPLDFTLDDAALWATLMMHDFMRVTRKGGSIVLMAEVHAVSAWMIAAERCGAAWMAELVVLWDTGKPKNRNFGSLHTHILWFAVPGARHVWNTDKRFVYSNLIVCNKIPAKDRRHPSQKPIELTNLLVSLLTRDNDVVCDPFCGSGSTLVSAELMGRPFLGVDADERNCQIARRRIAHCELEEESPLYLWANGKLERI